MPDVDSLVSSDAIDTVFILSRHDSHAELVAKALDSGKHVFVEKPLALSDEELDLVKTALDGSDRQLWVGFNRRHSESVTEARQVRGTTGGTWVANEIGRARGRARVWE